MATVTPSSAAIAQPSFCSRSTRTSAGPRMCPATSNSPVSSSRKAPAARALRTAGTAAPPLLAPELVRDLAEVGLQPGLQPGRPLGDQQAQRLAQPDPRRDPGA